MSLFSLRHKKHLTDRLGFIQEAHPIYIYLLSFVVGVLSSLATVGFIKLYELITRFIYNSPSTNFTEIAETTPLWYLFLILTAGGALIGLFTFYFVPYHGHGQGFPHLLYSYRHHSYITPQEGISTTIASSLSLGVGASVGREMPGIFFSTSITSWLCQILRLKGHTLRVLMSAAVGTSLATSLHSSFVGIFFVIEIITFSLTTLDLLPISLAIFTGVFIREFFSEILPPIALHLSVPYEGGIPFLNLFALGIICGLLAYLFIKTLAFTIRSSYYSHIPKWMWPLFGGLGLSLIAINFPEALGLGFGEMSILLRDSIPVMPLLFLLVAKYLAIIFSLGFGFSGGIFTPSIFWGLALGACYASLLNLVYSGGVHTPEMYILAGAAGFSSVTLGAPITLTLLAFEITRDIELTLNIFIVVFFAQVTMKVLHLKSFFHTQYQFLYEDCT
ncbi:MAG: H(+)/Cl(-) exchange transporter ClcA [Chlamydiae bacterium]|nr:H(+)/Cl(-) exchange transporter ClcA [Chlamydiota bacterium]